MSHNPYEPPELPSRPPHKDEEIDKEGLWFSMLILCLIFGLSAFFPLVIDTISDLFFIYKYGADY